MQTSYSERSLADWMKLIHGTLKLIHCTRQRLDEVEVILRKWQQTIAKNMFTNVLVKENKRMKSGWRLCYGCRKCASYSWPALVSSFWAASSSADSPTKGGKEKSKFNHATISTQHQITHVTNYMARIKLKFYKNIYTCIYISTVGFFHW